MIEKFYAAHIKNTLDAAAINTMRPRPGRPPARAEGDYSFKKIGGRNYREPAGHALPTGPIGPIEAPDNFYE